MRCSHINALPAAPYAAALHRRQITNGCYETAEEMTKNQQLLPTTRELLQV
jgi:hypothetical protein